MQIVCCAHATERSKVRGQVRVCACLLQLLGRQLRGDNDAEGVEEVRPRFEHLRDMAAKIPYEQSSCYVSKASQQMGLPDVRSRQRRRARRSGYHAPLTGSTIDGGLLSACAQSCVEAQKVHAFHKLWIPCTYALMPSCATAQMRAGCGGVQVPAIHRRTRVHSQQRTRVCGMQAPSPTKTRVGAHREKRSRGSCTRACGSTHSSTRTHGHGRRHAYTREQHKKKVSSPLHAHSKGGLAARLLLASMWQLPQQYTTVSAQKKWGSMRVRTAVPAHTSEHTHPHTR
eukprot:6194756-Pleurochrysis_carterae.AAC.2